MRLYGTICRALPPDLAEQLKSLDTSNGIRVTLRTGETFWFVPNTTVKAIVARIVERRHAISGTRAEFACSSPCAKYGIVNRASRPHRRALAFLGFWVRRLLGQRGEIGTASAC